MWSLLTYCTLIQITVIVSSGNYVVDRMMMMMMMTIYGARIYPCFNSMLITLERSQSSKWSFLSLMVRAGYVCVAIIHRTLTGHENLVNNYVKTYLLTTCRFVPCNILYVTKKSNTIRCLRWYYLSKAGMTSSYQRLHDSRHKSVLSNKRQNSVPLKSGQVYNDWLRPEFDLHTEQRL